MLYDNYNFDEIYKLINNYVNSLSNFYLDYTKDILYIEYYNRHSYIKLTNKQRIVTPYSLGYWENKLKPYSFSQCYRSYLVNCRFVADIKQDYVLLLNEEHIPLSRGFKKNFISSWLESVENQL